MLKKYDFLFSVGNFCLSSHILRQSHLQYESYPLDWMLFDNFEDVLSMIESGYNNLIDPNYLEKRDRYGEQDIYYHRKFHVELRHDFRHDTSFEDNLRIVGKRYQRRILRVNDRLLRAHSVLAVHCAQNCSDDIETIKRQFGRLQRHFADKHIDLLFIDMRTDISENRNEVINDHILKMNIATADFYDYKKMLQSAQHCLSGFDTSLKVKLLQRIRSFAAKVRKPLLKIAATLPMPRRYKNKIKAIYKDRFRA